jgi:hypothetical protein
MTRDLGTEELARIRRDAVIHLPTLRPAALHGLAAFAQAVEKRR